MAEPDGVPNRIRLVPDDYHTEHVGTAGDGRRFYVSEELFESGVGFVATFLWSADGDFDEVRVTSAARRAGFPPGQAVPVEGDALAEHLAALGDYRLEPIEIAPFAHEVDGVEFGFVPGAYDDGTPYVELNPGSVIAMYEPWDGEEYDT